MPHPAVNVTVTVRTGAAQRRVRRARRRWRADPLTRVAYRLVMMLCTGGTYAVYRVFRR